MGREKGDVGVRVYVLLVCMFVMFVRIVCSCWGLGVDRSDGISAGSAHLVWDWVIVVGVLSR